MPSILRGVIAGTALALCASFASAAVLSFDDIVGPNGYDAVPTTYGGLDWSAGGWSVFTAHSGDGRIAMGWDGTDASSTIRFVAPTLFEGAWFAGYGAAQGASMTRRMPTSV